MPEQAVDAVAPAPVDDLSAAAAGTEQTESSDPPAESAPAEGNTQQETPTVSEDVNTQDATDAEPEQAVPYARFKEINEAKKELEKKASVADKTLKYLSQQHNISEEAAAKLLEDSLEQSQAGPQDQAQAFDATAVRMAELEAQLEKTSERVALQTLDREVESFVAKHPEAKDFGEKLKNLALKDPETPVAQIWQDVYGDVVKASSSTETKEAKQKAQVAGSSAAGEGATQKDYKDMSAAELEAQLPKAGRNSYLY